MLPMLLATHLVESPRMGEGPVTVAPACECCCFFFFYDTGLNRAVRHGGVLGDSNVRKSRFYKAAGR